MQFKVAVICDFAQVREGLLSTISAGINRAWRETFPAPMDVMVALLVEMTYVEAKMPHEIRIRVEDDDGRNRLIEFVGAFQTEPSPLMDPGESLLMPLIFDFRSIELPTPGRYQIVVDPVTDDTDPTVLAFRADVPPTNPNG